MLFMIDQFFKNRMVIVLFSVPACYWIKDAEFSGQQRVVKREETLQRCGACLVSSDMQND